MLSATDDGFHYFPVVITPSGEILDTFPDPLADFSTDMSITYEQLDPTEEWLEKNLRFSKLLQHRATMAELRTQFNMRENSAAR